MDWVTDAACRWITKYVFENWGSVDDELIFWTEFMNVDGYCVHPERLIRHMLTIPSSYKTIAQIYGGKEETLLRTAIDLNEKYFNVFRWLELNIGCPSPKVMAGGWWSWMMKDKKNTLKILKEIKKNINMPLTIKTRSWLNNDDKKSQVDFILEASKLCDVISIHGRTLKQSHSGDVDWGFIYRIKQECSQNCKIIWNGWIKSYMEMLDLQNNLDWMMVGQSAIGNPWIFTPKIPTKSEIKEIVLKHLEIVAVCELYFRDWQQNVSWNCFLSMPTKLDIFKYKDILDLSIKENNKLKLRSVIEFRKFLFNYVKGIPNSKEFKVNVSNIHDYRDLIDEIDMFFS